MEWLTFAASGVVAMLIVLAILSRLFGAVKEPPRPFGVNPDDWERITERHPPHVQQFRRLK